MDAPVNRRIVRAGNLRVALSECGNGTPLLLLHGLGGPAMWQKVLEPLSRSFHVIAVDLPGFGDSDPPDPFPSAHSYASLLHNLISILSFRKVSVAGISYGGQIAAIFASEFPSQIEKLMLIAPTGFRDHHVFTNRLVWPLLRFCTRHIVFNSVFLTDLLGRKSFYHVNHRPDNLSRDFLTQLRDTRKLDNWLHLFRDALQIETDWVEKLGRVRTPTLILWGKNDLLVPVRYAEILKNSIPLSRVSILECCGHSLPLEQPRAMVSEVNEFFFYRPDKERG